MKKSYKHLKTKGNEKLTIMVVPHSQKEIRNIHLPKYLIYLTVVFLIGVLSFSLVTITKYVFLSIKQKEYAVENEKMIKELENLIYNSDNLINVQRTFSLSLNSLLETAGLSKEIFFNETGIGGPLVDSTNPALQETLADENGLNGEHIFSQIEEVKDLAKMEKEISVINKKINKLSKKLKYFEKITRYIPSMWPIMGDGDIIEATPSKMVVETLPFTPVVSTANGKITRISFVGDTIKMEIAHRYQFISTYSNLYNLEESIQEGVVVRKGQVLGYVAKNSGKTLFEYGIFIGNKNGRFPVNPLNFTYLGR